METRASYVLVGTFVLALFAALAGFALWLGRSSLEQRSNIYMIYFDTSVSGLRVGSAVRYKGIPVGSVSSIRLDPANIEKIEVQVEIAEGTPIVEGSVAKLSLQGITGGLFVEIDGGVQGNPPITARGGQRYPVIPSQPSSLAELLDSAPELMEKLTHLVDNANAFLSPENAQALTDILLHVRTIADVVAVETVALSDTLAQVDGLIANIDQLVIELRYSAARVSADVESTLQTIDGTVGQVGTSVEDLSQSLARTSDQLTALIQENRQGIRDFTSTGLYEFTLTLAALRDLADDLARVSTRFERGGANILFGDTEQGRPIVE